MINDIIIHKNTGDLYIIISAGLNQSDNQHYITICRLYENTPYNTIKTFVLPASCIESQYLNYRGQLTLTNSYGKFKVNSVTVLGSTLRVACTSSDNLVTILNRNIYRDPLNFTIKGGTHDSKI